MGGASEVGASSNDQGMQGLSDRRDVTLSSKGSLGKGHAKHAKLENWSVYRGLRDCQRSSGGYDDVVNAKFSQTCLDLHIFVPSQVSPVMH